VVGKDDLLPNNTSFVLAHLAHHLASADDMKASEAKAQFQIEALKKTPGKHDFRPIMEANAWAHLGDEAAALIDAWNATVDAAATQARAPMKIQQLPSFLMNLRYRGIFLQAVKQSPPHQLKIGEGGRIAPTQDNVRALAETLKTSQVMDVQ
jgi:hypothetical protein